jgi:DNA (cytosine-5)-methyltransferase 1
VRYASVCDGIGAAHVAWQPLGWECAWTSEIEPFPSAVVDERWKLKNVGDMTKLTEAQLHHEGTISLLVGGTPCQSFSVAGLRKGLEDPRGNLALRFTQLVGVLRPTWIVWENVPGVLSSGKGRDFGTFLGALAELGYGFAYRILDAQWFGVAQRRRRVFVVAHAGDWRRAAAVLFERESVFGNPPTRGAKGQGSASGFADGSGGGLAKPLGSHALSKGRGTDLDNTTYVAFAQNQRQEVRELAAAGALPSIRRGDAKNETLLAFTKSKRAQSTTDDESWVPGEVSPTMSCFDQGDTRATTVIAIQERAICENPDAGPDGAGVRADGVSYTLEARTVPQAVAFANRTRDGVKVPEVMKDGVVPALTNPGGGGRSDAVNVCVEQPVQVQWASGGGQTENPTMQALRANAEYNYQFLRQAMAVRRLTPRECERLQGFPDDYTLVEYRKKPAADGPRYRALGNSMAVPVMRWIGERIASVDSLDGSP